ncbi:ribonuclease Z [Pradoshia sp. D12]|uniref:ribonuclease Z n=1 Tax=Bacillaceae TaxID=186817 RepID=UPI00080ADE8B|nr:MULTISPECIES: ribonuclease Z [Bacillaceae]OCA86251.1 ribonuclease Z [Bacillus sp. FJAT-27986]QFK72047.1 ribonuclease Z [Pradoshia sp. D12]TPF71461.1 ribonuclease Z [Bacillus sp. D12]
MEFVFLGTGAGIPAKQRNVSSLILQMNEERGASWMFDCGEATQHQILRTPVKTRKIEKIFITHLHGDHIYGLPGLLGSRSFQGGTEPLTIYGPVGIKEYVETSLRLSQTHLKYDLSFVEIVEDGLLFEDETFRVEVLPLDHAILSYGYRIVEKDKPGELRADLLKEAGIPPGPLYSKLKKGEMVQLEDGRIINGRDYIGTPKPGRVIAILGDTRPCENTVNLALHAECIVHEATFQKGQEEMAADYFHSTTIQAAECAVKAGAKRLILTHISSRFTMDDEIELVNEAKAVFANTELARDFSVFKL